MVHKFAPLVKRQIEYWLQQIEFYPPNHPRFRPKKIDLYRDLVRDFTPLLDHLNTEEGTDLKPEQPRAPSRRGMRPSPPLPQAQLPIERPPTAQPATAPAPKDDLSDLPAELLAELSGVAKAETDPLIQIINARGGTATLDEILIDLYRNYKEVGKRTLIGNKLYRLGRRELVWSVPGKKGLYTTTRPTQAAAVEDQESESDDGPDAETSEPPSASDAKASSAFAKSRRDLFASTAIPPSRELK